jgi:hypothetical protein
VLTTTTKTINWTGHSGQQYQYSIYSIETSFKNEGGNYVYAKEVSPDRWTPLYIGQASSLGARLSNHEKESEARRYGASHTLLK